MEDYAWFVTAAVIAIAWSMQVMNIVKAKSISDYLQGRLESHEDLFYLRGAINMSMQMAMVYIGIVAAYVLYLGYLVFFTDMSMWDVRNPLLVFGVTTLVPGLIGRQFEKKLKELHVENEDPEISAIYRRWLRQWGEPRFKLPDY